MAKTIKVLKKHDITLHDNDFVIVPLEADKVKLVVKWIRKSNLLTFIFPEDRLQKLTKKERLGHKLFRGLIIQSMIIHWSHKGHVFLVKKNDKLIGFTASWLLDKDRNAFRIPLYLIPDERRKGYGSKILTMVAEFIKLSSPSSIILVPSIPQTEDIIVNFYKKNHFNIIDNSEQTNFTMYRKNV